MRHEAITTRKNSCGRLHFKLILRGHPVIGKRFVASCLAAQLFIIPAVVFSQNSGHKRTLIINGQSTEVPLIQVDGHAYVGLEALAAALKGTLSSSGKMFALSVPVGSPNSAPATNVTTSLPASTTAPTQAALPNQGFSSRIFERGD